MTIFPCADAGRALPTRPRIASRRAPTHIDSKRRMTPSLSDPAGPGARGSEERGGHLVNGRGDVLDVPLREERVEIEVDRPLENRVRARELTLPQGRLALVARTLPGAAPVRQ